MGESWVASETRGGYHSPMSVDVSSIQLPPPGVQLRLPPQTGRKLSYEEAYAQVRRHLKDDGGQATMSVQMKSQVQAIHAEPIRVGTSH
jgi:hypothetical protein